MIPNPFFDFDTQKAPFSIGFIRYFDMAKCYVVYSEKGNAFWCFWHLKGLPVADLEPSAPKSIPADPGKFLTLYIDIVHCTLYRGSVHCTLYIVLCTLYIGDSPYIVI